MTVVGDWFGEWSNGVGSKQQLLPNITGCCEFMIVKPLRRLDFCETVQFFSEASFFRLRVKTSNQFKLMIIEVLNHVRSSSHFMGDKNYIDQNKSIIDNIVKVFHFLCAPHRRFGNLNFKHKS